MVYKVRPTLLSLVCRDTSIFFFKVGILPKENIQQVDFAFHIYTTTGYQGFKLSREFKLTFAYA